LSWAIVPRATKSTSEEVSEAIDAVANGDYGCAIGKILSESLHAKLYNRLKEVASEKGEGEPDERHVTSINIYTQKIEDIIDEVQEDADSKCSGDRKCKMWADFVKLTLNKTFADILEELKNPSAPP